MKKAENHTENMIAHNKQSINLLKKNTIKVKGKKFLKSINIEVPGDPSSASFFTALTLLNNKSSLVIKNVGLNSTRIGFFKLLKKHGAKINFKILKKIILKLLGTFLLKVVN